MAKNSEISEIENLSFEVSLAELESIVQKLETGKAELEESIALYERGAKLKAHCEGKLKAAQEKIEKIVSLDGKDAKTEALRFE